MIWQTELIWKTVHRYGTGRNPSNASNRLQEQSLLSTSVTKSLNDVCSLSVIVYPPTLQFVTISFFLKNAMAYCTFYIYLAKPLSKVHVSNNRSNTDYYAQDIPLHSGIVNKIG